MPIQLIIHYDNGISEVAAQGTRQEVMVIALSIASEIDPDTALWEFKEVPTPCDPKLIDASLTSQLGMTERSRHDG